MTIAFRWTRAEKRRARACQSALRGSACGDCLGHWKMSLGPQYPILCRGFFKVMWSAMRSLSQSRLRATRKSRQFHALLPSGTSFFTNSSSGNGSACAAGPSSLFDGSHGVSYEEVLALAAMSCGLDVRPLDDRLELPSVSVE